MKSSDLPSFSRCLQGIGMLYGKPINNFLLEIYWQACQEFEFVEIEKAFQAHMKDPDHGHFMPKPADVVRYLKGSKETQAFCLWGQVVQAIKSIGCYSSVAFQDRVIHMVIADMGGWVYLCQTKEEELVFKEREFAKRYGAYLLHPPAECPPHLKGYFDGQIIKVGDYSVLPKG